MFSDEDQQRFASVSGDYNPIHMDALVARRTQAGAPVVHGIQLLLWALDALAAAQPELPSLLKLRAQFSKFVYLHELAEVVVTQQDATHVRLNVSVEGLERAKFHCELGEAGENSAAWLEGLEEIPFSRVAMDVKFEEMAGRRGRLRFQMTPADAAALFPAATRWLGARRVSALAASSHLVGMMVPGLHSIYGGLALSSCAYEEAEEFLAFWVEGTDERFRTVNQQITGGGWMGTVKSVARRPPVAQATMESLAGMVGTEEFAGSVALIVGGSRGLGELTAKLIAKGGGRTIVTWHRGRADAERVAGEIQAAGGACETLAYDVRRPAAEQLAGLAEVPTHLYYFATPPIFRAQAELFVGARLKELLAVYVDGFWELARVLGNRQPRLSLFYPSSVYVEERPAGMTEYAMAKAAGEALCRDMNVAPAPMHVTVNRLPRLPTDQTVSFFEEEMGDALETMAPIIREVQSWPK
jgi:hypothetical protein